MADADQGDRGGYLRHRYAPAGHTQRQGSDGYLHRGSGAADFVLRGPERAGEHKKRQAQGIAAAKARGVKFGRPEVPVPENFAAIVAAWERDKLPLSDAVRQCRVSEATFYRRLRELRLSQRK